MVSEIVFTLVLYSVVQLEIKTFIITNDETSTANEQKLATIKTRLTLTYICFLIGIHSMPLWGMELQEKEAQKD